jgi:hypothetical protein
MILFPFFDSLSRGTASSSDSLGQTTPVIETANGANTAFGSLQLPSQMGNSPSDIWPFSPALIYKKG